MKILALAAAMTVMASTAAATETEVILPAGKGELHGSLRTPAGFTSGPAVLIIAGSGPTDRNGDSSVPGVSPQTYRMLADALEAAGVPSLRYDKRGVGASAAALVGAGGMTPQAAITAETDLRFTDYADDAVAMAETLRKTAGVSCVVILGHSEGSLLGMLAAQKTPVCGYISVSGLGRSADQTLWDQIGPQVPPDLGVKLKGVLAELKAGRTVPGAPVPALFRDSIQPYMISWFRYDPSVEIAKIKAPVLILQGENDVQVAVSEAKRLKAARPDATLVLLPGVNHVLKAAPADRTANINTYGDPKLPLGPGVIDAIVPFVKAAGARH